MKKWSITRPDEAAAGALTKGSDLEPLCAAVLAARGIRTVQAAADFLGSDELSDPFLIRDMQEAAEVINEAVESGKPICVYGDYDCDGVTATVMLYSYLECLGADVRFYIPERSEGYGMNEASIRQLAQEGVSLIITADNGIAALAEAELIAQLGMTLVVTDHHQPGECLPRAAAVVNPHRADCPSPYKNLCGAGVALKLIAALDGGGYDMALEQFGDLAAIGTAETVHAATRGENITVIFINNTTYGMTGGQMAPTTLPGQVTQTTPYGRNPDVEGFPVRVCEMLSTLSGVALAERVTVTDPANIRKAKAAIRKGFEFQKNKQGFSIIEVLSTCPTNWGLSPVEAIKWLKENMVPYYPLGVFKEGAIR